MASDFIYLNSPRLPRRNSEGDRLFTVAYASEGRDEGHRIQTVPLIRMRGRWLQKLGFRKGTRFVVKAQRGELVIKVERGK